MQIPVIEPPNSEQIFSRLKELLSSEKGYLGHVKTWGQSRNEYENIGYIIPDQMLSVIENMPADDRMHLGRMMTYFEIHMRPLKHMLNTEDNSIGKIFADWAWSHFAILIMFGLLELAVRHEKGLSEGQPLNQKGKEIKSFLARHLDSVEKESITKKYRQADRKAGKLIINTFDNVADDMWKRIRSEFVHEGGIDSAPLEGTTFSDGGEKEGAPVIAVMSDVAVYEWLKITWQVTLSSFGYTDKLKSEPIKRI